MRRIIALIAMVLVSVAGNATKLRNTNAVWVWSKYMNEVNLQELKSKGIGNVILHEYSFTSHGEDSTMAFINAARRKGIAVHVWVQVFYSGGKWISPVDDGNNCYRQDHYDEVIGRCRHYLDLGVEAIHFDYIRFGGTAHKHNPSPEVTATGAITEFCRQASEALREVNPRVILSAALMPEPDSEYYYGQDPSQMGRYLDILIPMIYRHSPAYSKGGEEWVVQVARHFVEKGSPARVWAGTTTYTGDDGKTIPMDSAGILADCETFRGTGVSGIAIFRYGLGEIPDMRKFKIKKRI